MNLCGRGLQCPLSEPSGDRSCSSGLSSTPELEKSILPKAGGKPSVGSVGT